MLKQLLSKLPRKSSRSDSNESNRGDSSHSSPSQDTSARINERSNRSNSGNSSVRHNSAKRTSSSTVFPASIVSGIEPLVPFKDVPNAEKMNLFVSKLSLCCVTFDFTDPVKIIVEKDVKRKTLLELVDFVDSGSMKFSETLSLLCAKLVPLISSEFSRLIIGQMAIVKRMAVVSRKIDGDFRGDLFSEGNRDKWRRGTN